MILWLTGNTGAGKTTLARRLCEGSRNTVMLDGDELRTVWPGLGLSIADRTEQNLRVARLARLLESQGLAVVVAVIAPTVAIRAAVEREIPHVKWLYVPGGATGPEYPYEPPVDVLTMQP